MQIKSVQKFVRQSPRKLRLVAGVVRNMDPVKALEVLPNLEKRAAEPLAKVIKTALANAHVKGLSDDSLTIEEIQINEGPRLKRGRPVSRGRWHPYKRRMSHIRVVLATKTSGVENKPRKKASATQDTKVKRDDTVGMKSLPTVSNTKRKSTAKTIKSKTKRKVSKKK